MPKYTLYVDESGDIGIERIRGNGQGGATPYLTLGAVLVNNDHEEALKTKLQEIEQKIGKNSLHCNELNHAQKTYFARTIAQEEITLFGLISNKSTLAGYAQLIDGDVRKYYNKCAIYLLERVGAYLKEKEIAAGDLTICFEEGPFDYGKLCNFIRACQRNPFHANARLLQNINSYDLAPYPKEDKPLLQIADLVAHALFKSADRHDGNYNIPEPRYLNEIHERFYCDQDTLRIEGTGLKSIQNLYQLQLDPAVHDLIDNYKGVI